MTTANVLVNHSETVQTSSSMAKGVPGTATARAVAWSIARTFIIVGLLAVVLGLAPAFAGAQAFALDDSATLKTAPGDLATQAEGEGAGGGEAGDPLASGACGESATWTLSSEGLLSIQGEGSMTNWTSDSAVPWYAHRDKVVSVEIGDGITSIGSRAFKSLTKLANVSIAASVATIGASAFQGCTALSELTVGDGSMLDAIDSSAFGGCTALSLVKTTSKVFCFYVKNVLKNAEMFEKIVQSLPVDEATALRYAYSPGGQGAWIVGITRTTSFLTVPVKLADVPVVGIAEGAFTVADETGTIVDNTDLREIAFAEGIQIADIEDRAFQKCSSLVSFSLPVGVSAIGARAFEGCKLLSSFAFDDDSALKSVGDYALQDCTSLNRIELPSTVDAIGKRAFNGVNTVVFRENKSALLEVGNEMFYGCANVALGEGTTTVGARGFSNALVSVTLPESLGMVGANGFIGCNKLASVRIPDAVTSIGASAFQGCSSLADVSLSRTSQLGSIGASAFSSCSAMQAFEIPETVSYVGNQAFSSCKKLQAMRIPAAVGALGEKTFFNCSSLASVVFAEGTGLASIGASAFEGCSALEGFDAPATLVSIGEKAFKGAAKLSSLSFAENPALKTISASAFENCFRSGFENSERLASVSLPSTVEWLGEAAFKNCSKLETITLNSLDMYLGPECFMGIADPSIIYVAKNDDVQPNPMYAKLAENENLLDKDATFIAVIGDNLHLITDETVTVSNVVYRGPGTTPIVTVVCDGAELNSETDYDIVLEEAPHTGEMMALIRGKGQYIGFARKMFTVMASQVPVPVANNGLVYNAAEQQGVAAGDGYTIKSGGAATKAGSYTAVVSLVDKQNYVWSDGSGSEDKQISWSIAPAPVVVTAQNATKAYGEKDPTFTAIVDYGTVPETNSRAVKYALSRGTAGENIGDYAIAVTGNALQGNYAVTFVPATLTIEKRDLSSASITLGRSNYIYDGQAAEPSVSVRVAGKKLEAGKDYTLEYADNTEVGTAKVLVTGIGNYRGVADKSFTISRAAVTVTPVAASKEYGDADPVFTAKVTGVPAGHESDIVYALSRAGGEKIGSYTITAAGASAQGNYTVRFGTARLTISQTSISDATVSFAKASYPYTGTFVKPAPVVKLAGKMLKVGVDYTVSYSSNINDGTAQATVRGMGGYAGSAVGSFKIAGIPAGKTATVAGATYKAKTNSTAVFKKAPVAQAKVRVPAKVVIHGKRYKVVGIAPKAFKGTATKTVIVKSKALTKAKVRKCLKGSQVKTVKVPAAKKNAYKKIFAKKNVGKKVKVK